MSNENFTEKVRVGFTKKAIAFAVLGMAISALLWPAVSLSPSSGSPRWPVRYRFPFSDDEYWSYAGGHFFPAFIGSFSVGLALVFIGGLINYGAMKGWWNTRFSEQELALIMILAPLGGIWGGSDYLYPWDQITVVEGLKPGMVKDPSWWDLVPPIVFGPRDASVWSYWYVPGVSVKPRYLPWQIPWLAILPNILTFYVFFLSFAVCLICAAMLMRYICIRVEYLAFPFNEVYGGFVDLAKPDSKTKQLKMFSKPFLIGFLISFIWQFSLWDADQWVMLIKGEIFQRYQGYLPDPTTGYPSNILAWPVYDFTIHDLIDWAPLLFSAGLWEIGWASLIPLNILLSGLIGFLAMFVVFPPVYTYIVNEDLMEPGTTAVTALKRLYRGYYWGGPSIVTVYVGACLAVVVATFVNNWREVSTILKSIVKEPFSEFDPDRPLPYRWIWWIMIASFLLWYLIGVGLFKIYPLPLLIFGLAMIVLYTGSAKIISETGGWMGCMFARRGPAYVQFIGAVLTEEFNFLPVDGPLTVSSITSLWITRGGRNINNWLETVPWYSLYGMKMADSKRINKKMMLIAIIGGIALALILSVILFEIRLAYSSLPRRPGKGIFTVIKNAVKGRQDGYMWRLYTQYPMETWYTILASFSIFLALSILQRYIGALRSLSIGGLIVGAYVGYGLWGAWLTAFIIKYLVIRIGGVRLYEEKLKPIALGFFGGGLLAHLLGSIGWALQNIC